MILGILNLCNLVQTSGISEIDYKTSWIKIVLN